ncbi:unnamed protein product [Fusarium graminearum]|uniref:Chromosome 1, complete genome n=1 Tax=Gibberella zeae (strain ATCC MYA-4620 / CBS 123657 / FGSC 9075 / NRRL 31084 / PH-1) TaxID=229533 RepID=A0A098DCC5_GIBZE|nr:unnamed protein product [Fusarium graminearum]
MASAGPRSEWCTNERELYDMHTDPYQMVNLYQSTGFLLGNPVEKVTSCLKGLMMVLKRCQGQQCVSHGIHYIQRVM